MENDRRTPTNDDDGVVVVTRESAQAVAQTAQDRVRREDTTEEQPVRCELGYGLRKKAADFRLEYTAATE